VGSGALIDPPLRHLTAGVVIEDDASSLEIVQHPLLPGLALGSLTRLGILVKARKESHILCSV
jgi:hypothetical protein